ncbi:short-chain fatty acyl-CoA regulator family protein [bacterium]|nr:short-chain fatty acyl-CoA regulator family protein [bacterium]
MLEELALVTQRLAGSRIREKRLDRGLRQAAVAETVGISPSYLNLIEHNRRRIGGKLLSDIARVLGVEPALLVDGADADMLDQMRHAASQFEADLPAKVEVARAEEMAARYPGWGALIVAQSERIAALGGQVQALSDRMSHDPQLAGSLHDVITAVSAIRSAAQILVGPEKLDEDWQRRFHENIHNDSLRLANSSEALVAYLEAPDADIDQADPAEQLERYLAKTGFHLAPLEAPDADLQKLVADSGLRDGAKALLESQATQYLKDAALLPLAGFEDACRVRNYNPAALAQAFQASFATVLRRLASLPTGQGHPPIGMAACDAAGVLTLVKPVPGFALPRTGGACPLWPLYAALNRPAQPIRLEVALPGSSATRLLCYAIADTRPSPRFDVPTPVQSTMLVMPDPPETASIAQPVGVSCRICPRANCASRREPAMKGARVETAL